jgi:hypothetical protein
LSGLRLARTTAAIAHNLTLVTHNTREFERVEGLQLEDWVAIPQASALRTIALLYGLMELRGQIPLTHTRH